MASVRLVVEENTSDNFFEGFLVQARVDGETTPRGSFDVGDTSYMQTLDCTSADVSALSGQHRRRQQPSAAEGHDPPNPLI